MSCQKCLASKARHRVFSDVLNVEVCTSCAIIALELEIPVEVFPRLQTDHQPSHTEGSQDHYGFFTRGLSYYSNLYLAKT